MGTLAIHPYHLQEKSEIIKLGYPIIGHSDRIFTVPVGRITLKLCCKEVPCPSYGEGFCILQKTDSDLIVPPSITLMSFIKP